MQTVQSHKRTFSDGLGNEWWVYMTPREVPRTSDDRLLVFYSPHSAAQRRLEWRRDAAGLDELEEQTLRELVKQARPF